MIIVIADDVSGAAELAGLAHARGFRAEVQTRFYPDTSAEVIALDTDTRSAPTDGAAQRVAEVVRQILAAQPAWIYKKTDSVLRGHIRVELSSLLTHTGLRRCLFIPANPSRGRRIRGGQYWIQEIPLDQTLFAQDPEYPATTASVERLLMREEGAKVVLLDRHADRPNEGIAVPDVESPADLARHAARRDSDTLYAGAAEFFAALLAAREGNRPGAAALGIGLPAKLPGLDLLICGSAAAWPGRREECTRRSLPALVVDPEAFQELEARRDRTVLSRWADQAASTLTAAGGGVVALGDPPPVYRNAPQLLLATLAHAVALLLEKTVVRRLFLEGGATAAAVLGQMQWTRLAVAGHLASDLALWQVADEKAPLLAIKPGSYPWPESVWPESRP